MINAPKSKTDEAWDELCAAADERPAATKIASAALNPAEHPFLKLGPKPYRFEGVEHVARGGRHCALCGKSIRNLYIIADGDNALHTLGSECILNMSNGFERSIVAQVKTRKRQYDRELRAKRAERKAAEALENSMKLKGEECRFLQEYVGPSDFFNSLKQQLAAKGELSDRQFDAVTKAILKRAEAAKADTFPAERAFLAAHKGTTDFFASLKGQLEARGDLSPRQWACVTKALAPKPEPVTAASAPEQAKAFTLAVGETLIITKFLARVVGKETGLNRPHFAVEVLEVHAETERAYKIKGRLSAQRTSFCCVCGRTLENPVSVQAGIGPICGKRFEVSTTEELHAKLATEYKATVELWIPKSQIKERKEKSA